MKILEKYIKSEGTVQCEVSPGRFVSLPIAPAILKHPTLEQLPEILKRPDAARKYTIEALRHAPWQVVREFDREWLKECMEVADLRPARRAALDLMLGAATKTV